MMALQKLGTKSRNFFGILAIAMLFVGSTAAYVITKADFKGEWNFNESKSKLGEGRFRAAAQKLKVSGEGESISIERTVNTPNGETMTTTDKLTFDGKAAESTVFGSMKKSSTAAWAADGESMT